MRKRMARNMFEEFEFMLYNADGTKRELKPIPDYYKEEDKQAHESVGKRICALRKRYNLTQKALAEKLFISDKAVSKWESDNGVPSTELLVKISQLFGVTVDYILTGEKSHFFNVGTKWKLLDHLDLNSNNTLIMGNVGTGKSVLLYNVIETALEKNLYDKIYLFDLKNVEFEKYEHNEKCEIINNYIYADEKLGDLCYDIDKREDGRQDSKPILIVFDEITDIISGIKGIVDDFLKILLENGRKVNMHVLAAAHPNRYVRKYNIIDMFDCWIEIKEHMPEMGDVTAELQRFIELNYKDQRLNKSIEVPYLCHPPAAY